MKSTFFTLLSLSAQLHGVECFWRMICDRPIVTARIDPIITPGAISAHAHSVTGASGVTYDATFEDLRNSDCTTCQVTQDHSAYWVPQLYYTHQNGTYESVDMTGGLTVYYLKRGDAGPAGKVLAVPNGLRMIAGDPFRRSYNSSDVAQRAIGFSCLGGIGYTKSLEAINNCPNGLRAEIFFPNCWDGVNLDSNDHSSHMAYSGDDGNGACPSSHPVKIVSLFFEAMWSIDYWKDDWWNGTTPPFVFAQGDPTGYGSHGDFMSGWDQDFLQTAVDTCNNNSGLIQDCPVFNIDQTSAASCKWAGKLLTTEDVLGTNGGLSTLPGCNPVTYGPDEAPIHPSTCPDGSANNVVKVASNNAASSARSISPSAVVQNLVQLQPAASSTAGASQSAISASRAPRPSALVQAEARTLALDSSSGSTASSSTAVHNPLYGNTTARSTTLVAVTTKFLTATAAGEPTVITSTVYETKMVEQSTSVSQPSVNQNADAATATATDADVATDADAVTDAVAPAARVKAQVAAAGNVQQGNDGVVYRVEEEIEYYTITTTLIESSTPYVQLYVIPATATTLLAVGTTLPVSSAPTGTPRTVTRTMYQTVTQTTFVQEGNSLASMKVDLAFPSMAAFANGTTLSSNSTGSVVSIG